MSDKPIKLVNRNGRIVGEDPETGEEVPVSFGRLRADEISGIADYVVQSESGLDDAISNAEANETVWSGGFETVTAAKTFDDPLNWVHHGDLKADGDHLIEIGADGSNPGRGSITIHGDVRSESTTTDQSVVRHVSGSRWHIEIRGSVWGPDPSQFEHLWWWDPSSRSSTTYYEGNKLTVGNVNQVAGTGWEIPAEPSNVFIEGNQLEVTAALHATGVPISLSGGAYQLFVGSPHQEGDTLEWDDRDSRGYNRGVMQFQTVGDKIGQHPKSVVGTAAKPSGGVGAHIVDDFNDDRLESRRGASQGGYVALDTGRTFGRYRPEWSVALGSASARGGELVLPAGDTTVQEIRTDLDVDVGEWRISYEWRSTPSSGAAEFRYLWQGGNDMLRVNIDADGTLELAKVDDGSVSTLLSPSDTADDTAAHEISVSRDADGTMELSRDGATLGTVTDSFVPDPNRVVLVNTADAGIGFDDLEVE